MSGSDDEGVGPEFLLTRRQLVGGGFGLLAAGGLLAACGGGGAETSAGAGTTAAATTPPAATTAPADTAPAGPTPGGRIRAAYSASFDRIGTTLWGGIGFTGGYATFDRLLRLSADGKSLEPELLESMPEISADGTLYTFRLRQGVKFHDGSELTAEDVKFTLERQIDPEAKADAASLYASFGIVGTDAFTGEQADDIAGLRVIDASTLEMELDAPNSSIPYALSMTMASIVPKAYVLEVGSDAFEQKPVGTGPYKVTAFEPTRSLTWDRFEEYYDPERGGYADGIDFEFNVDTNLGMLRIQQGELDLMADPVPAGMLQQLEDDPAQADNLKLGTINNVYYVTCSTKHPALQVLEARQAVAYAIDKEKLVRQLGGLGQEADGGLFSPLSPYYQPGLSAPYDPERAKALLAEAGFADGFEIEILSQPVDPQKTIAQAVQADLEAVGISAKASILPQEVWLERVFAYGPEMVLSQWELPYPHGSYVMDSAFTTTAIEAGCCNFSQWSDSRFDTLAEEARETSDEAQLVELYKEMDAYAVGEQALWIPVLYPGYAGLKSARLQGYEVPGTPAGDVLFFANYWIQES